MTFTDDDLKQLKDYLERHKLQPHDYTKTEHCVMVALLARLEAAENYIGQLETFGWDTKTHPYREAWIAAKGEK
jgi:hypothetical protein